MGINHPGPASIYMSRTDDLVNDVGDGEWFKIEYEGPVNDTNWAMDIPTPGNEYGFRTDVSFSSIFSLFHLFYPHLPTQLPFL